MRLSLKTKFTLATSLLVLAVVTVVSGSVSRPPDQPGPATSGRSRAICGPAGFSRLPECPCGSRGNGARPAFLAAQMMSASMFARPSITAALSIRSSNPLLATRQPSTKSPSAIKTAMCWFPAMPRKAGRRCRYGRVPSTLVARQLHSNSSALFMVRRKPTSTRCHLQLGLRAFR